MPKFNKGDRVRVRLVSHSRYRGQIGVVDDNPSRSSSGFWYMVRFDWKGLHPATLFAEEDLEAVSDEVLPEETPATVDFTRRSRWTIGNKIAQVSTTRKYLLITLILVLILTAVLVTYNNIGIKENSPTSFGSSPTMTEPPLPAQGSTDGATKLAFATELVGATAGSAFPIQPAVKIEDVDGNIVTTSTASVTLIVTDNRARLYGLTTVNAVNGIATFSDLSIRLAGFNYSLTAISSGLTSALSDSFSVAPGAAAMLFFIRDPFGRGLGSYFSSEIAILDVYGNIVTDSTAEVTLSITPDSGTPGATLSGVTTQKATDGIATFSYLLINPVDGNYKLTATSPGLTSDISQSFNPAEITENKAQ